MLWKYIIAILLVSFSLEDVFPFVITSFLMSLIMLLYVIIKRILLNVRVTRKKIFISLGLNFVIISVEIIGILTYKLMTRGYI